MANHLKAVLLTLGVSAVPGLEMRTGIPLGVVMGLPAGVAAAAGIVGNVLQIPVALWTVDAAHRLLDRAPAVHRWFARMEEQAQRYAALVRRWGWLGMSLFLLIPLPVTGVWSGVVMAKVVRLRGWALWVGLALGLIILGVVYGLLTTGALAAWRLLF